jgi:hypothetical protein
MPRWVRPGQRNKPGPGCAQKGSVVPFFGVLPQGIVFISQEKSLVKKGSGESLQKTRIFPQRLFGGRKLRFPPSNVRFALCLPFAGLCSATKRAIPLGTPVLCFANQQNPPFFGLRSPLGKPRGTVPAALWGLLEGLPLALRNKRGRCPLRLRRTSRYPPLAPGKKRIPCQPAFAEDITFFMALINCSRGEGGLL